jgi:hypothetical protein
MFRLYGRWRRYIMGRLTKKIICIGTTLHNYAFVEVGSKMRERASFGTHEWFLRPPEIIKISLPLFK